MDALCLKAGIHSVMAPPVAAAPAADKPSVSAAAPRNLPWGFTFRHPLRSLWPAGKNRFEPAIAVDDAVLVDEKEGNKDNIGEDIGEESQNENWVVKILHVKSLWRSTEERGGQDGELAEEAGAESEECDACAIDYDDDDDEEEEDDDVGRIEFNRETFSRLLKKVPLAEARLYAQMSYLGNLAYSIPQIKPRNLLRYHRLRYVTSSLEKKEEALKAEKEKVPDEKDEQSEKLKGTERKDEEKSNGNRISASAAYQIAASAASYLHSHTRSILRFKSSGSMSSEDLEEEINGGMVNVEEMMKNNQDVASLMATTDSVTAVVAAKEEVKQAVADDLNSTRSSPCEWFVCDDDQSAMRYFVIQGSESLASWQANLLFEPIQFEGMDVLVHRGIYEAAKGIYEQMLPEIQAHLRTHGDRATLQFTGHSLGGSLSLLVNLMLLIRGVAPRSSLLPVITFGAPSIMCGGDRLLRKLGLPRNHARSITMHRDIVPRAFSCNYPNHVAELLKAVNGSFRNHPCLNKQKVLYAPMGEFLILQPDNKFSPSHDLLPSGSGLYIMTFPGLDFAEAEKRIQAAQAVFLNSPHPLEILSDRAAYGSGGTIQRDHDMNSYLKSIRNVIRQELSRIRKARRGHRRKVWWPLVAPGTVNAGLIVTRPVSSSSSTFGQRQLSFSGIVQTGKQSWKRFSTLVASQHMHLLVVLLFPARLLILGTYSLISFR